MALTSPGSVPSVFIEALKSETTFSNLHLEQLEIYKMGSRNTLYKYADKLFSSYKNEFGETGWKYLNRLRKTVYQELKLTTYTDAPKEGKHSLKKVISEQKEEIRQLQIYVLKQGKAYAWLFEELSGICRSQAMDERTRKRIINCVNHNKELFGHIFDPDPIETTQRGTVLKFNLDRNSEL